MAHFLDRRTFLHTSLLTAAALSFPSLSAAEKQRIVARPFQLSQVKLRPGAALDAMNVNRRHLMAYDPDRLLHTFRLTAGLPSSAEPLGGWEVSAFPEELFDRLRTGQQVWAPFYTLHKIMAGMLDMHVLAGNAQASSACSTRATATSSTTCRCKAASGKCSARRITTSGAAPEAWPKRSRSWATASTSSASCRTRRSRRAIRVTLTVRANTPRRAQLRIRVPYWSTGGSASLNDKQLESFATPSSYLVLDRTWRDGDRVEARLQMRLHSAPMPDDPTVQAVMSGPIVLAGKLGAEGLTAENLRAEPTKPRTVPEYKGEPIAAPVIRASTADPAAWLKPSGTPLEFRTVGQPRELTLVPLNRIFDERYAVYWKFRPGAVSIRRRADRHWDRHP